MHAVRRALSILGLVLLAAAAVAVAVWYGHRDEPVEILHVAIPPEEMAAYRAALQANPRPPVAADAGLLAAFEAMNRAEAEALVRTARHTDAGPSEQSQALAVIQWEKTAGDFVQEASPELFADLGRRQGLRFLETTRAAVALCTQARLDLEKCLVERAETPEVQAHVALGGQFLLHAVRAGLVVQENGAFHIPADREPYLQAVFLDHWTRAVRETYAPEALLTAQEVSWLNRWKAEWQLEGAADRRVAAALSLRHVPGYPAELNAGVLLYHAGRYAEAAEHFARAPESIAALYRRLAVARAESR